MTSSAVVAATELKVASTELQEKFAVFYVSHRVMFIRMATRLVGRDTAEDIVQQAYCDAWRYLHTLREDEALSKWFHSIVRNQCLEHRRLCCVRLVHIDIGEAQLTQGTPDYDTALLVRELIASVPWRERKILRARLAEEYNADRKDRKPFALADRLRFHRAVKLLRERLGVL
jgi:DNA-directed RNA polymerase specialized sigma24 family protein